MAAVPPAVVHDTLWTVVHDTTRVRDTVWVLSSNKQPVLWGITVPLVVGWLVTIGGFLLAAHLAVRGWKMAAQTAREAQDRAVQLAREERRRTFLTVARDTINFCAGGAEEATRHYRLNDKASALTIMMMVARMKTLEALRADVGLFEDHELRFGVEAWQTLMERIEKDFTAAEEKERIASGNGDRAGFVRILPLLTIVRRLGRRILSLMDGERLKLDEWPPDAFDAELEAQLRQQAATKATPAGAS